MGRPFDASQPRGHRIGLMDSGVGGLSVARSVKKLHPDAELYYLCDNGAFPYGTKTAAFLEERVTALGVRFVSTFDLDAIVVACNTASTICLPSLRQALKVPVVGVVPAVKPAASITQTGAIALWATERTASGSYTANLIEEFAPGIDVRTFAATRLVEEAERFMRNEPVDRSYLELLLRKTLDPEPHVDVVVLGCTHFPLLVDVLRSLAPRPVTWLDSGDAVARRLSEVLVASLSEGEKSTRQAGVLVTTAGVDQLLVETIAGEFDLSSHPVLFE